jgi:hypothetical protein
MREMSNCAYCDKPLARYDFGRPARFCCRECGDAYFREEHRQAVKLFRSMGMRVRRANGYAVGPDIETQDAQEERLA